MTKKTPEQKEKEHQADIAYVVAVSLMPVLVIVYLNSSTIWSFLVHWLTASGAQIAVTLFAIAIGFFLFNLKHSRPFTYAAMEITFAGFTAWLGTNKLIDDPSNWTIVAAAGYLTVRGLDNWKRAKELKSSESSEERTHTSPAHSPSTPASSPESERGSSSDGTVATE